MSKMEYSAYKHKSNYDKIPLANSTKQNLKKTPTNNPSQRERSAKPNHLPQILKDYQLFCEKYFNTNTTQSQSNGQVAYSSMTPPIQLPSFSLSNQHSSLQDPQQLIQTQSKLSFLEGTDFSFSHTAISSDDLLAKVTLQFDKQSIGLEKNCKYDYAQRLKKIASNKQKDSKGNEENPNDNDDKYEEEFNFKDELEIDHNKDKANSNEEKSNEHDKNIINDNSNDNSKSDHLNNEDKANQVNDNNAKPIKIFDESTHNIINEEIRNQNATKIQIYFKSQCDNKRRRDRIFLGYDKTDRHIVTIYIDKSSRTKENRKDFDIFSLLFKIFSLEAHAVTYETKAIRDLLFNDSITYKQIEKVIPDLIEKVLKQDKEDSGYDFDEIKSEKAVPNDIRQSISSIDQCDYDNI